MIAGRGTRQDVGQRAFEEDTLAVWASFISAALGLLAGGAATYFTTRAQLRAEAEHAYDRSRSRDLRLPHYQRLFHLTRVMPREWLPSTIPCKVNVISIRESLRDWYFSEESGGMFLSQPARDQYFRLYDELESAIAGLGDDAEALSREAPQNCANEPVPFAINSWLISGLQNDPVPDGSCQQRRNRPHCRNSALCARCALSGMVRFRAWTWWLICNVCTDGSRTKLSMHIDDEHIEPGRALQTRAADS